MVVVFQPRVLEDSNVQIRGRAVADLHQSVR